MGVTNKVLLTLILATLVVINVFSLGHVIVNKALAKQQPFEPRKPGVFIIVISAEIHTRHLATLAHQEEQHLLKHVPFEPISPLDMNGASTFEMPLR